MTPEVRKQIEEGVKEIAKKSTAPDKETPDWMETDIRRGAEFGYQLACKSSHPEQGEQGELYRWVKDAIESYVYKWPPEIQEAMRKDILFGYDLGYQEFLALIIESNEILRSCYQVAARGGKETNWPALTSRIQSILEKQHKAIYMPNSKLSSPPPEGQDGRIKELENFLRTIRTGDLETIRKEASCLLIKK